MDLKGYIASVLNITFPDEYRQTTGDHQITECMREIAREREERSFNDLLAKCWLVRDTMPASISIDNLLDAHRNDPDIAMFGKLAIAAETKSAPPVKPLSMAATPAMASIWTVMATVCRMSLIAVSADPSCLVREFPYSVA